MWKMHQATNGRAISAGDAGKGMRIKEKNQNGARWRRCRNEKDGSGNWKKCGEKTDLVAAGFNFCLDVIEGREEDG